MKISSLVQQERIAALEGRRKILLRKEVGDAYRKNLQYFQPKKSPFLVELENLLFGRKDHDLYEQHKEESKELTPKEQATLQEMQQTEKNVRAHEQAYKALDNDNVNTTSVDSIEEDKLLILETIRSAALAPANPSPQDLRVAASASVQIQQVQAKRNGIEIEETDLLDEEPAFVRESIKVKVPERFSKDLKLDPFVDTIFGKSYEVAFRANIFQEVATKYSKHSEMAKGGYRLMHEPRFSWTA